MAVLGLIALLSLGLALYLAPLLIHAARRYGILDHPDGNLKEQREPVAYLGGFAVFIAMVIALAVTEAFDPRLLALLLGASIVVSVGLIDDLGTLTPKDKLLGQLLVALVLVKGGILIELEAVPFPVAALASVVWIVAVVNAFNIIDVADGLCAGTGLVASAVMTFFMWHQGARAEAYVCAALAGALAGFLRFNWQPARMYLGDTGSMLVGTVLAAVTMMGEYSAQNVVAPLVAPLGVLVVPLFDITFVVLVRLRLGLRIDRGSPDHFAVRLRRHGVSPARVAAGAMVVSALGGAAAVVATLGEAPHALALGAAGTVLCVGAGLWLWRLDPRAVPAAAPTAAPAAVPANTAARAGPP